jgi:hypothetical protein
MFNSLELVGQHLLIRSFSLLIKEVLKEAQVMLVVDPTRQSWTAPSTECQNPNSKMMDK